MTDQVSPTAAPERFRLPSERHSITHKFRIGEFKAYLTTGFYDDGRIGEIFIEAEKQGSIVSGLLVAFGRSISIGLQHGIPLDHFVKSFEYMRFSPEGFTENKEVRNARSIMDYIFRYLDHRLDHGYLTELRPPQPEAKPEQPALVADQERVAEERQDRRVDPVDDSSDPPYPKPSQRASSASSQLAISCKPDKG